MKQFNRLIIALAAIVLAAPSLRAQTTRPTWFLVDAAKGYNDPSARVRELHAGDQLVADELPAKVNLEYLPLNAGRCVRVTLDGQRLQGGPVEGNKPFSVFGDDSGGHWLAGVLTTAHHKAEAVCYGAWNAPPVLESTSLEFDVLATRPAARPVVDQVTLVRPPWVGMDGRVTVLRRNTDYVVPKGWGTCYAKGWTMQAEPGSGRLPRIVFTDSFAGAWLLNFDRTSAGNTLKDFDVLVGADPLVNRNGILLGGTSNTLDNVGFGGGNTQLKGKDEDVRNLHLLNLRTIADVGGYFLYAGSGNAGHYSGFVLKGSRIVCAIASNFGIAHPIRLYDVGDALLEDNVTDVRSSTKYAAKFPWCTSTSGLRLHRGTDGIRVVGGDYAGFQSWISPLQGTEPPLSHVTVTGATFRNSINVGTGATDITFDHCTFTTGSTFCLSLSAGTSGKFLNCGFVTAANNVVFDSSGGRWTFSGNTRNGAAWR